MEKLPRDIMPQIDYEDLEDAEKRVKIRSIQAVLKLLHPSQRNFHREKILELCKEVKSPQDFKPIIISNDGYIVDGHHRWIACAYKFGINNKIPAYEVNLPIKEALILFKQLEQKN